MKNSREISLLKNIKENRIRKGMTQEQLADLLYVARQTVSSWESGNSEPDICKLTAMSKVFNVSVDTLIYGREFKEEEIMQNMAKRGAGSDDETKCGQAKELTRDCLSILKEKRIGIQPGYYTICREDITELCIPEIYRNIDLLTYYRIILKLKDRDYNIIDVTPDFLSVLLDTKSQAERFLLNIVSSYGEVMVEDLYHIPSLDDGRLLHAMDEVVREEVLGTTNNELYYWSDGTILEEKRGYGLSVEECKEQARRAKCYNFEIRDKEYKRVYATKCYDELNDIECFRTFMLGDIYIVTENDDATLTHEAFCPEIFLEVLPDGAYKVFPENLLQIARDLKHISFKVNEPQETCYGKLVLLMPKDY